MLYKGKRNGYFLYELTATDLVWEDPQVKHYKLGNVLLFNDKRHIALGSELVKADDLSSAYDYLEGNVRYPDAASEHERTALIALEEQLKQSEAKLKERDDLLKDLAADRESQQSSNQILIAQLEALQEQIRIERLSRNEVIDDLEEASAETFRKEQELEKVTDAKTYLEQELAARICELLELDSANTELQKRLEAQAAESQATTPSATISAQISPPANVQSLPSSTAILPEAQVLTTADGKQIHVYHEFPSARKGLLGRGLSPLARLVRTIVIVAGALIFLLLGSAAATAYLNNISLGEALDVMMRSFLP